MEKEYLSDKVTQVLDDYGFLYGDVVEYGDHVNIVGVDEEEWEEVQQAIESELGLEVLVPDEDHAELDNELIVLQESLKEDLEPSIKDKLDALYNEDDVYFDIAKDADDDDFLIVDDWEDVQAIQQALKPDFEPKDKYDTSVLDEIFDNGYQWGFRDEYTVCDCCGKVIRTEPDSYSWLPDFFVNDEEGTICCGDCVRENPKEYLATLYNNADKANTILSADELEAQGFEKIDGDFESGWYDKHDSPDEILDKALEEHPSGVFIFNISGQGQFATQFELWGADLDLDESLNESMKSEVTKWWKDVEDENIAMQWGYKIDNGDYDDVEAMHAAMFDMLDELKERGAFELFNRGKKIYNKYAKYSKYNSAKILTTKEESLNESKEELKNALEMQIAWCKSVLNNPNGRQAMDAKANYGKSYIKQVKADLANFEKRLNELDESLEEDDKVEEDFTDYGKKIMLDAEKAELKDRLDPFTGSFEFKTKQELEDNKSKIKDWIKSHGEYFVVKTKNDEYYLTSWNDAEDEVINLTEDLVELENDTEIESFDTYEEAHKYLQDFAKKNHIKYFDIVEDAYEIPNGLLFIEYDEFGNEKSHYPLVQYKEKIKKEVKEDLDAFDDDFELSCKDIATSLSNGWWHGQTQSGRNWGLSVNGKNGNQFSPRFADVISAEVAYPVGDGVTDFYGLDLFLTRDMLDYVNFEDEKDLETLKNDLLTVDASEEDIDRFLKDEDDEIEVFIDFEIDADDVELEEDLNYNEVFKNAYKKLDDLHIYFNVDKNKFEFNTREDALTAWNELSKMFGDKNVELSDFEVAVKLEKDLKEDKNEMSFEQFLKDADILIVDDAKSFDINKWEEENQKEIDEELELDDSQEELKQDAKKFIKYRLDENSVKEIIKKLSESDFSIVDDRTSWKTKQFLKKKNLTFDDLKEVLRNLQVEDYKTNSKPTTENEGYNEAIIFVKNTKVKDLGPFSLYIKLDYDSIEESPVVVISLHQASNNKQKVNSSLKEEVNDSYKIHVYDIDWSNFSDEDVEYELGIEDTDKDYKEKIAKWKEEHLPLELSIEIKNSEDISTKNDLELAAENEIYNKLGWYPKDYKIEVLEKPEIKIPDGFELFDGYATEVGQVGRELITKSGEHFFVTDESEDDYGFWTSRDKRDIKKGLGRYLSAHRVKFVSIELLEDFKSDMKFLADDEVEAIDGYQEIIDKVEDKHVAKQLRHIQDEEEAHLKYLNKVQDDKSANYEHE